MQSPTRLKLPVRDPLSGMAFQRPLLSWDNDSTLAKDVARLRQRDDVMGTFVSPSGRAVALTLEHTDGLSKAGATVWRQRLRRGRMTCTPPNPPSAMFTCRDVPWLKPTTWASWSAKWRGL